MAEPIGRFHDGRRYYGGSLLWLTFQDGRRRPPAADRWPPPPLDRRLRRRAPAADRWPPPPSTAASVEDDADDDGLRTTDDAVDADADGVESEEEEEDEEGGGRGEEEEKRGGGGRLG